MLLRVGVCCCAMSYDTLYGCVLLCIFAMLLLRCGDAVVFVLLLFCCCYDVVMLLCVVAAM